MWNSGKVASADCFNILYAGKEIKTGQDCWWQVRVWDADGKRSRWSEPARWGAGMMSESDWKARWIGAEYTGDLPQNLREDHEFQPAPLLRKSFTVDRRVASAKVFVCGLGFYEFYINGSKVCEDVLTPNETNYDHRADLESRGIPVEDNFTAYRVLYNVYDITEMLQKGENVAGAMLGCGWYDINSGWCMGYGSPRLIAQIEIKYKDGTSQTVISDDSWMTHAGPVVKNGMYAGEVYDATAEIDGWCAPGTDTSDWKPAVLKRAPAGMLTAHTGLSDKVMEVARPSSIKKNDDGTWNVTFPEYISGWVRLSGINAAAGDTVSVIHHAETSGNGDYVYIAKGTGNESYAPHFTWYAFQDVTVSGWKGELTEDNICAEVVYSDVHVNSTFECSNELFNRINTIWRRSQTDNMHLGVASDCPHRERGPYTGDGQCACVTVLHNYDAAAFYTKWVRDMADCQNPETGYVPNGAPWHNGCGGGVGWGAAIHIIPWEYYLHYGDITMLEHSYSAMKAHLGQMRQWVTEDGIMFQKEPRSIEGGTYWMNLGDWLPPYDLPRDELVHTFYLWKCTDYTARTARALGLEEEAAVFEAQAEEVKKAFHAHFYDPKAHSYGMYGSNVMALRMGVPDEVKGDVCATLRAEIDSCGGHLNTGITGTQVFFETLADNGLNDLAFEAMNKRDYPSFGWWLEQGATTTWERWDGKDSRNHPMFGGGITWFYRKLVGLEADESAPGYRHIIFRPMPVGDVKWASYSTETLYGKASIAWRYDREGAFHMDVTVPVGCSATVVFPDGSDPVEISSGSYSF